MPVHGEALHMHEHAKLARHAGIGKVVTCRDGDLVRLAPGTPGVVDEVPSGRLYKDGALLVGAGERTVQDRRRLGFAGVVSVALAVTERGDIVGDPEIELTGVPETDAHGNVIGEIVYDAVLEAIDSMPKPRRRDPDAVAEAARRAVRAVISGVWNKKPTCHVHVLTV
jgi:ribonuclease J